MHRINRNQLRTAIPIKAMNSCPVSRAEKFSDLDLLNEVEEESTEEWAPSHCGKSIIIVKVLL